MKPEGARRLEVRPCTITRAKEIIRAWHRHHPPPQGGLFAVGCAPISSPDLCGVAIVGRPVSRELAKADPFLAEVTRTCTNGEPNANSCLYGACWRAAKALGYRRLRTYTLPTESGSSLKAEEFKLIGETRAQSWDRRKRRRTDKHPTTKKLIWEVSSNMKGST